MSEDLDRIKDIQAHLQMIRNAMAKGHDLTQDERDSMAIIHHATADMISRVVRKMKQEWTRPVDCTYDGKPTVHSIGCALSKHYIRGGQYMAVHPALFRDLGIEIFETTLSGKASSCFGMDMKADPEIPEGEIHIVGERGLMAVMRRK